MGFGLISMGWMFLFDIPWKIDLLVDFLGCFLIIAGCKRLKPYSVHFGNAARWFGVLILPSVCITALEIANMAWPKQILSDCILHLEMVHTLIFTMATYFMLQALIRISTDVGRTKIAKKCRRNMGISLVAVVFYMATRLLINLPFGNDRLTDIIRISWLIANVIWYCMLMLHFIQIFSCYMWICYEGDEDMPMKEHSMKTNPYARFEQKKAAREEEKANEAATKKKKKKK